ncbi:putative pyridoxal 5'-phosphate synthase subunit PDX2 [Podospora aff. communis PSN243]|uniref:glutaminase n=1 Tax=Podospora aff. communis PSN243 TaxID=3040156 RepID=A0AAV9H110_9PEZI|nr:putative pyridoxal 5'-phosphate synthase subunit PDX2 [Podospora aff. communis PSN243]
MSPPTMPPLTIGVLALQGGVGEHIALLQKAAAHLASTQPETLPSDPPFSFLEVRTADTLAQCDALIIPGGESTTMAIVARRLGLLDPLRQFVKVDNKPVWGTCAGLVMLAEEASATKQGGQELVGGLDVRVLRNRYGTQIQSFVADLELPFLGEEERPFRGVFIRAPVVEEIIAPAAEGEVVNGAGKKGGVEVLGVYRKKGGGEGEGDIVAVKQRNVFGTSFHPELTDDVRIHVWWLKRVLEGVRHGGLVVSA